MGRPGRSPAATRTIRERRGIPDMMPVAGTNRIVGGAVLASALIALALAALAGPARAQVVPPNRNAVNFSVATFSGAPVWSLGFSYGITEHLDLTASYSFQSPAG